MNFLSLFGAFSVTVLALAALRPVAPKIGLLDFPGGRKTHVGATPQVGGLGIFFGLTVLTLLSADILAEFAPLLSLAALVVFVGVIDDIKDLKASVRMTGHVLVALAMAVVADIRLESLGGLVSSQDVILGALAIPVTTFATVGVINAINMADGIDGLSGSLVTIALCCIGIAAYSSGDLVKVSFIALLICCIFAYLTLNFRSPWNRKALIYLGDAGSTMLGFILAWLLIESTQGASSIFAPAHALWFLAIPLFDTVNLLIKRPLRGQSPFKPGVDHLHHMMLRRGFTVLQVVITLTFVALLFAGVGLAALSMQASESAMFQLFVGLFLIYFIFSDSIDPAAQDASTE